MNLYALGYFNHNLNKSHKAQRYLSRRGVSGLSVYNFNIGYAGGGDSIGLYNYLLDKGFTGEDMSISGLFIPVALSDDEVSLVDRFRDRIVFPIILETGAVVGFSGRVMENKTPKYINSPASVWFNKSKILYGLNKSWWRIIQEGFVILVEGNLDVVSLYQEGIKNVVATCGTSFTEWHAKRLYCLTDRVVIAYDEDEAGRKSRKKVAGILNRFGVKVDHLEFPEGYDPDSFIREFGKQTFEGLVRG